MNILLWMFLGAIAGWVASLIVGTDTPRRALGRIAVGVVGALTGGTLMRSVGMSDINSFSTSGIIVSILGSIMCIVVISAFSERI